MPRTPDAIYQELTEYLRQSAVLASCSSVLDWDEQTCMPPGGVEHRSNQLSLLAGLNHDRSTSPILGELLNELEHSDLLADDDSPAAVNVREARRDYNRATRIPKRLIEELSKTASLAHQGWVSARKDADFGVFRPWLEKIVALKREEAQAVGYGSGTPYDALLDQYEPGMTVAQLQRLFTPLREELVALIAAIGETGRQPKRDILTRQYPIAAQRQFATEAATQIGFDFNCGRLDEAPHPFCSGFGPGDTRLTTRYDERHFPGAFFGTLHEAGHGIYDQGLDQDAYGLPMGEAVSLGIHESQSRMWENFVGRSRSFWTFFFPKAQAAFPAALGNVPLDDFYAAVNDVQQSFIRVEADEATYNLHILLRFEIEQALIADELRPEDVPGVWDTKFTEYFGITPPNAAQGCLQDIHWSMGGMGYFPTYTLGNMNAAQFFAAAKNDLGDLDAQFTRGEFGPLKHWLNEQIHRRGKQYRAERLVEVVTGEPLSHTALMTHLRGKLGELYGL